jgi:hypothetical protein
VVKRLKQLGLDCTQRTLKKSPFVDTRYLVLKLDGPELPKQQIVDQLRVVHGILSIDKLVQVNSTSTNVTGNKKKNKRQQTIAPEAGDAEIRDRMLVFSLLSRYPNVGGRLYEIISTIPEEDRLIRAKQLGHGFGLYLFEQQKITTPVKNLPDALSRIILPAISPMADLYLQDNVLTVISSKINIKPKKPLEHSCHFLHGALNGLLSAPLGGIYRIEKLCCAAHGAEHCKFQFQAPDHF